MKRNNQMLRIALIIVVSILIIYLVKKYFQSTIGSVLEIVVALIGVGLVILQLSKEHQITKAQFIYNLNDSFSNNENIAYIYNKLKACRDCELYFTPDEGRKMGDYLMFFEIMEYLICEDIITLSMADAIFANKFFLFMHHDDTWKYQNQYDGINKPILLLYEQWYNYRLKHKMDVLYPRFNISTNKEYFETIIKKGEIVGIKYKKNKEKKYPNQENPQASNNS